MQTPELLLREYGDSCVSVLAVTPRDADRLALRSITSGTRWNLHEAGSVAGALQAVASSNIGVVISDSVLPDGTWVDLLESLRSRHNPPRVIVYSPVADTKFWADVLTLGGYDVLATPFDAEAVLRAGYAGWLSWSLASRATPSGDRRGSVFGMPTLLGKSAKVG